MHLKSVYLKVAQKKKSIQTQLSEAMLEEKLDAPEVREYFETLGLDVWDAWTFFKLLDLDAGVHPMGGGWYGGGMGSKWKLDRLMMIGG